MSGKKADGKSGGVMGWISTACHFAADRNDFRRFVIIVVNDVTQTVMLLLRSTTRSNVQMYSFKYPASICSDPICFIVTGISL